MNRKQLISALQDSGIGFEVSASGIKITHVLADYKPYKLMPIRITDWAKKKLENRSKKPIKPSMRPYPQDEASYVDFLHDRCQESLEAIENRYAERREARLEGIKELERVAHEKWDYDPDKDEELQESRREYEARLESHRRRLPGWRRSQQQES